MTSYNTLMPEYGTADIMAAKNLPVQAGMVSLPSPSALALGARIKMKVMSKILVIISFDL